MHAETKICYAGTKNCYKFHPFHLLASQPPRSLPFSIVSFASIKGAKHRKIILIPSTLAMSRKRKDDSRREISGAKDDPNFAVDKNEIKKLTKLAKSWEFTCSFCFKRFPSAQALGGHQNAHRAERQEERRLYIRDPIGYRKRAYLQSVKKAETSGGSSSSTNLHAASEVLKDELACINDPPEMGTKPSHIPGYSGEFNASSYGNNNLCHPSVFKDSPTNGENLNEMPLTVMNFIPPEELNLAERLGGHAEDAKGKACTELDTGGYGLDLQNLDLALKL